MNRPAREIEETRRSHVRLIEALSDLTDVQARGASRLPGWTVGHILTHIARNADSVVRRLQACERGEVVDQYPAGAAGRSAEIDDGANRTTAALVLDVVESAGRLDALAEGISADIWERPIRQVNGSEAPAHSMMFSRWREVEVHHSDLGLGYSPADWPRSLADAWLPQMLSSLPARADVAGLLAWTLGRGEAPELAPWA